MVRQRNGEKVRATPLQQKNVEREQRGRMSKEELCEPQDKGEWQKSLKQEK